MWGYAQNTYAPLSLFMGIDIAPSLIPFRVKRAISSRSVINFSISSSDILSEIFLPNIFRASGTEMIIGIT
jgi:hypothetical protein